MPAGDRKMKQHVEEHLAELRLMGQNPSRGRIGLLNKLADDWDGQRPHRSRASLDAKWIQKWFLTNYNHLAPNSRRTYRSWVTNFVKWGADEDYWKNSAAKFKPGKVSTRRSKTPHWMTPEFMRQCWEGENWYKRGLTAFASLTMARGGEVVTLKVGDLDLAARRIDIVRWKTDDYDDRLPMVPELVAEMELYLRRYAEVAGEPVTSDMFLFPRFGRSGWGSPDGWVRPDTKRSAPGPALKDVIVKNLEPEQAKDPKITTGLGGHSFRRSSARALFERLTRVYKEADAMRVVQGMLGHEDTLNTQRYIGLGSVRAVRDRVMDNITMFDDLGGMADVLSLVNSGSYTLNAREALVGGVPVPYAAEDDAA